LSVESDVFELSMPEGAEPLSVDRTCLGEPTLWPRVDTDKDDTLQVRRFRVVGSGYEVRADGKFVGVLYAQHRSMPAFHVFDLGSVEERAIIFVPRMTSEEEKQVIRDEASLRAREVFVLEVDPRDCVVASERLVESTTDEYVQQLAEDVESDVASRMADLSASRGQS
jgi:hypothetical protein